MTAVATDVDRRIQFACDVMDLLQAGQGGRALTSAETRQLEAAFDRGSSPRDCANQIAGDRLENGEVAVQVIARRGGKLAGLAATVNALRDRAKCPTCDKTTLVFNLARRGERPERISLETHCGCKGGPAHHLVARPS